jgi:hypothetical protein
MYPQVMTAVTTKQPAFFPSRFRRWQSGQMAGIRQPTRRQRLVSPEDARIGGRSYPHYGWLYLPAARQAR